MVDKVEYASKIVGQDTAIEFYKTARQDLGPHVELVLLPLIITYELINEVDGDGTFDSI